MSWITMAQPLSALVMMISSVLFDSSKPSSSLLETLLYELFLVFVSCSLMCFFCYFYECVYCVVYF